MTAEKTKVTVPVQAGSHRAASADLACESQGGYQLSVAISVWQIFRPHSPSGIDTSTLLYTAVSHGSVRTSGAQ